MRPRNHSPDPFPLPFIILLLLALVGLLVEPQFAAHTEIIRSDPLVDPLHERSVKVLLSANKTETYTYSPVKFFLIMDNESAPIKGYDIEFGDGDSETIRVNSWNSAEVADTEHKYDYSGNLTVKARCNFDNGTDSNWTLMNLVVLNRRPTCRIRANVTTIHSMESVRFTCIDPADKDGDIANAYFDFGDGEISEWYYLERIAHVYQKAGEYTANVRVKDNEGAISAPANITITVLNRPPAALFHVDGPDVLYPYVNVLFAGNDSYDGDGTVVSYHWDFGDGRDANGKWVTHGFSGPGEYTVNLTVKDDHGLPGYIEKTVRVVKDPGSTSAKGSAISPMTWAIGVVLVTAVALISVFILIRRRKNRERERDEIVKRLERMGDRALVSAEGLPLTKFETERQLRLLEMYQEKIEIKKDPSAHEPAEDAGGEIFHEIDHPDDSKADDGDIEGIRLFFRSPGHYKGKKTGVKTESDEWRMRKRLAEDYAPKEKEQVPISENLRGKKPKEDKKKKEPPTQTRPSGKKKPKSQKIKPSRQKLVLPTLPGLDEKREISKNVKGKRTPGTASAGKQVKNKRKKIRKKTTNR